MKITVLAIGKLKEAYWRAASEEYLKRLGRYVRIQVTELEDLPVPERATAGQNAQILEKEGTSILDRISSRDYVVIMDIGGKDLTSEQLSEHIEAWQMSGRDVFIVIGGSLGLSDEVRKRADERISMGRMTFPHQLARIMILEQIYRGYKIISGEPYHK